MTSLLTAMALLGVWRESSARAAVFDFDTGTPPVVPTQNIGASLSQTSDGITATFSSPQYASPDGRFSLQTSGTQPSITVLSFSGNYLFPSRPEADSLHIQFSANLTSIGFDFGTTDYSPIDIPNTIQLLAFLDSTAVGSTTASGTYGGTTGLDSVPTGYFSYNSGGVAFNRVELSLVQPGNTPTGFMLDNISVELVPEPVHLALGAFAALFVGVQVVRTCKERRATRRQPPIVSIPQAPQRPNALLTQ